MRDTDADWKNLAEEKPYFGILTDPKFLPENIDENSKNEFFASGEADIERIVTIIRQKVAADFRPVHAVDFGCGVGRLAFPMARIAQRVTGVDVAPAMLQEALRQRDQRRLDAVSFLMEIPSEPYDWVNSYIVLQHIPPERGYAIIDRLLDGLSAGGLASLHVTTHRDARVMGNQFTVAGIYRYMEGNVEILADPDRGQVGEVTMYDYDLGRVLALFIRNRINGTWLDHTDHGGHHGFHIVGRKI